MFSSASIAHDSGQTKSIENLLENTECAHRMMVSVGDSTSIPTRWKTFEVV